MLELIPTLFAQQQLKQAVSPISPIEPAQTQTKLAPSVSTPAPAIATPESVFVSIPQVSVPVLVEAFPTPIAAPQATTPTPVSSAISLPQAPQIPSLPATAQSQPAPKQSSTPPTKLTEKPTSAAGSASAQRPAPVDQPSLPQLNRSTSAIEIPVPPPQTASQPLIQSQKQLLEQRLAEIVAKDRAVKQAAQRDTLVARAYSLATQRRFEQARKLLQDPAISADVRIQILSNINSLESASRTVGITQIKDPLKKSAIASIKPIPPTIAVKKTPVSVPIRTARSSIVTIQVPRAIQSLPIQQKALVNDPTAPIASDSIGGYIDQLVTPKNLQAYNRNLPKLRSGDQILYPLPQPVPVTSGFGWRQHPVTGVRRFHSGVDLGAGQGTPVIAARGGKVTIADRMGGYGLAIVLQQPDGSQDTLYAHLSQIFVRPGEKIQPGTIIGRVGSTGLSTGPHLHYEARRMTNSGWTAVDPAGQLEAARVRLVQARQMNAQSTPDAGS